MTANTRSHHAPTFVHAANTSRGHARDASLHRFTVSSFVALSIVALSQVSCASDDAAKKDSMAKADDSQAHSGASDASHDAAHDKQAAHDKHDKHDKHHGGDVHARDGARYGHDSQDGHESHDGHHRFDNAEKWAARFEDPSRDEWQRPDVVIAALSLTPSSIVADVGGATGYFPVRIAPHVPGGKVYSVDIEPDMIAYINARAEKEGLKNLQGILGHADDPKFPSKVDRVLVVNTYHHINARPEYFKKMKSSLNGGARVVVVDFKMGELPFGPPEHMRIPPDQIISEMGAAGFVVVNDDRTSLPHQVILTFAPRAVP